MKNIQTIAKNTFKEAIRDRILYVIVIFSVIFILSDLFIAQISLNNSVTVRSFGLAGIYIFGMLSAIFLGSSLINKEVERKTLYFILSKPVSRAELVIGKFLGLFYAVSMATALMAVVYLCVVFLSTGSLAVLDIVAVFLQILEQMLFIALLVFFSAIASPLTSTISAFVLLFIGHIIGIALENAKQASWLIYNFVLFIYYVFPNLEKFDIRNIVVHNAGISPETVLLTLGYALFYCLLLLICTIKLFQKMEL